MILVDFSQILLSAIYADASAQECAKHPSLESSQMLKHYVLNSLRYINKTHSKKYGKIVICTDAQSWRTDIFPHYKWARKQKRAKDDSGIVWDFVYQISDEVKDVISAYLKYPLISVPGAEGDDCIGTLTKYISTNGTKTETEENLFESHEPEPILIVSSDKDNFQLHRYPNVKQFCPREKKLISPKEKPELCLMEKIISGDSGDGIPGILCADDHFVNPPAKRVVLSAKKRAIIESAILDGTIDTLPEYANYLRNQRLISYEFTPQNIQDQIILLYNTHKNQPPNKMGMMNYLISHKMKVLVGQLTDFF